jgi:hypothetical protein
MHKGQASGLEYVISGSEKPRKTEKSYIKSPQQNSVRERHKENI